MAKTAIWGQTYKVLVDTGLTQDEFILDSSQLNGIDVLDGTVDFADATEYVTSINIRRGRSSQLDAMSVGQASIVFDDKASGRSFDPANTASPYVESGYGIAPRRFIQIYGGTAGDEPLFVGRVNDLDIEYVQPDNSFCIISAVDELSDFGRTNLLAFNPSSQLTSARVSAILDRPEVAYSTATRDIQTGVATVGTVAYQDNVNVKSALDAVVSAEDGRFFINRGGTATFQQRISFSFTTATIAFADTGGTAIPYQELSVGYGAETLYNRVQVDVQGFAMSTAVDSTSVSDFGINTLSLSAVPLDSQASGDTLAASLLDKYKDPIVRFNEMSVVLNGLSAADAQTVSTLDIGDLVQVTKTYITGSPLTVTKTMFVENIAHEIRPQTHRIRFGLGQAYVVFPLVLDDATFGILDADNALGETAQFNMNLLTEQGANLMTEDNDFLITETVLP